MCLGIIPPCCYLLRKTLCSHSSQPCLLVFNIFRIEAWPQFCQLEASECQSLQADGDCINTWWHRCRFMKHTLMPLSVHASISWSLERNRTWGSKPDLQKSPASRSPSRALPLSHVLFSPWYPFLSLISVVQGQEKKVWGPTLPLSLAVQSALYHFYFSGFLSKVVEGRADLSTTAPSRGGKQCNGCLCLPLQ